MDVFVYWAARSPIYLELCREISSIALLWPFVLLLALSLRYQSHNGINAAADQLWVDSSWTDVWHMVTQDECWLSRIYFSFLTFSDVLLCSSSHKRHACSVPLLYLRFSVIMDPVVNNAAGERHCTTFSHERSLSLCRVSSPSLPPRPPLGTLLQNSFICFHWPRLSAFAQPM